MDAFLEITQNCNLNCSHCYLSQKKKNDLSREEWFSIIDKLKYFNIKNCIIFGGESLLHKNAYDIISYAISRFRNVSIQTNATLPSYFQNYNCEVNVSFESCFKEENDKIRKFANSNQSVYELAVKKMLAGKKYDNPRICLTPNQRIITIDKIKTIDSINNEDYVLTYNGNFNKVKNILSRDYNNKIIKIRAMYSNNILETTPEHPIFAIKTKKCSYQDSKQLRIKTCRYGCQAKKQHRKEDVIPNNIYYKAMKMKENGLGPIRVSKILNLSQAMVEKWFYRGCKPWQFYKPQKCEEYYKLYKPEWIKSKELEKGDYLVYPIMTKIEDKKTLDITNYDKRPFQNAKKEGNIKSYNSFKEVPRFIQLKPSFFRLCGYYLAEGFCSTSKNGSAIFFAFHIKEKKYYNDVKKLLKKYFNLDSKIKKNGLNSCVVIAYSKSIGLLFEGLFKKIATNKMMPQWFLYLPKNKQIELIRGLIRGDGSFKHPGGFTYTTASENLAYQIRLILMRLGFLSQIARYKTTEKIIRGHKIKGGIIYRMGIYGEQTIRLERLLKEKLINRKENGRKYQIGFIDKNYAYFPITKIETENYNGKVYNLEVENDESYSTLNSCVHNCRMTLYNDSDVLASIVFAEKLGANLTLVPLMRQGCAENLIHRIPNAQKINEAIRICMEANEKMQGHHEVQVPQWYLANLDLFNKYKGLFLKQKRICPCAVQRLFINSKADVLGCMFVPHIKFGNLLKDKISKIEKNINEFNNRIKMIKPQGKCKGCDAAKFCGYGCLATWIKSKKQMGENCPMRI